MKLVILPHLPKPYRSRFFGAFALRKTRKLNTVLTEQSRSRPLITFKSKIYQLISEKYCVISATKKDNVRRNGMSRYFLDRLMIAIQFLDQVLDLLPAEGVCGPAELALYFHLFIFGRQLLQFIAPE